MHYVCIYVYIHAHTHISRYTYTPLYLSLCTVYPWLESRLALNSLFSRLSLPLPTFLEPLIGPALPDPPCFPLP